MTFQPPLNAPIEAAVAEQLSILFAGPEEEAEALFRIVSRFALDRLRAVEIALRSKRGAAYRRRREALEWALDFPEANLPQAVGLLSKDLFAFARRTLYTPEELRADRDADRNFADDGRDLLREREALLADALGRIARGEMTTIEAAAQLGTLLEGARFNLPHYLRTAADGRSVLDERFDRYLATHHGDGDEGKPALLLESLRADFNGSADVSLWRIAALDTEGDEHLLAPPAEAVTEGGEIILAKIRPAEAGPEPLPFREMAREPLPLFERFDVDGAFAREVEADIAERDAFARLRGETPEMPIPWASAVAERWINLAIALWATSTRKGLRELIPSLTASTHNSVSDVLVEGGFRNFASGDPGEIVYTIALPHNRMLRSKGPSFRVVAKLDLEGLDRGFDAVTFSGRRAKPQRAVEELVNLEVLTELARLGSAVAASATGRAIIWHLVEEMTQIYNRADVYTRRQIHLGELKPQIIIEGGFAGLAERVGDHSRGQGYPEFFDLFALLRFHLATRTGALPLGQLLSYRIIPAAPGHAAQLRVILHDALLPFSYGNGARLDRSALVPIISNVPRPAKLSRNLYRAHDNFADALLRHLVTHYEQTLDLGGVELTRETLEELASRYAPAILPHLENSFGALVKGETEAQSRKRRQAPPMLQNTAPGRYRISDAYAEAHRFATEGAQMRDAGRRRAAAAIAAEKSERRGLGDT